MFVTAVAGELRTWGIGKLLAQNGADCTVEYFDAPMAEPTLRQCLASDLRSVSLPSQSRVYSFNPEIGAWEIGRVLDDHGDTQLVKFPNGATRLLSVAKVFVRWDHPIVDPSAFLAARINETPRFVEGRMPFMRSLLQQRSASLGMSALPSSAIELEAHQIEVVRKVLQDPIQRYLLADEVGLGKTIEAGVLIRQCVLDDRRSARVLVLAPDALVSQWRLELASKFFLDDLLDDTVFVEPFSASERVRRRLKTTTMLVIDEAHHVTSGGGDGGLGLYDDLVSAAPTIDRMLLLSATPALHNERGFLRMLHLLDPRGYPLDQEDAFRKRVAERQALAEIVASLTPENALYLDGVLDQLVEMFSDDHRLQARADRLRALIVDMPAEDDPELVATIGLVRDHLSEVYRLHRRVLRHRRQNVTGLTPERSGADIVAYSSTEGRRAAEAFEDWRFSAIASSGAPGMAIAPSDIDACARLSEVKAEYRTIPVSLPSPVPDLVPSSEAFLTAMAAARSPTRNQARIAALVEAISARMAPKLHFIIFCSDPGTADEVARALAHELGRTVDRHDPQNDAWRGFGEDPERSILVCDARAEEGLNLQGGKKVVVHFDLPLNPNRIEQRLGRADRYGSGEAVRSIVLCCQDDPLEVAWSAYVDGALRVFDRSIASLQYLIESTVRGLPELLLTEGVEGLSELTARDGGEQGQIEREIRNINQQEALDALGDPPSETLDALADLDDDWRAIEDDLDGWIQTTLLFGRSNEPPGPTSGAPGGAFRYRYMTGSHHTLVPLEDFYARCKPAIDTTLQVPRSRDVWTTPYTYRRPSALSRQGRAVQARLLRYGDPLLSGLRELTQRDERGRSTAFWRHLPIDTPQEAEVFFRFDFLVETEVDHALGILDLAGAFSDPAASSLNRRGDMALAPSFHTVWLDADGQPVVEDGRLALLDLPYRVDASDQGGRDFNLNPKRWSVLKALQVPQLDRWADLCDHARSSAETYLRALPALSEGLEAAARRAEAMDAGRLGLLQARAERRGDRDPGDEHDLHLERALSEQLIAGIRTPRVTLDAVCACFLGSDLRIATALGRA